MGRNASRTYPRAACVSGSGSQSCRRAEKFPRVEVPENSRTPQPAAPRDRLEARNPLTCPYSCSRRCLRQCTLHALRSTPCAGPHLESAGATNTHAAKPPPPISMRHPHTPLLSFPPAFPFFAFYRKSAPPIAPDSTSYGPHPHNPADLPESPAPATASDRSRLPSWPRLSRSSSASHPYPRALCAFFLASSPTGRFATPSKFICPRGGSAVASLDVIRTEILPELPRRSTAAHHTHWLTSGRLLPRSIISGPGSKAARANLPEESDL